MAPRTIQAGWIRRAWFIAVQMMARRQRDSPGQSATTRRRLARLQHCRTVLVHDLRGDLLAEDHLVPRGVNHHGIALHELTLEQPERQRVLYQLLDRPLHRPGAIRRVVA